MENNLTIRKAERQDVPLLEFMNIIRLFGFSLVAVLLSFCISACSSSSDDNDNGGGSSSASMEGTWYLKSLKGYYYYPADGRLEPHNSNKNPDAEYDDYSDYLVLTVAKNGENYITKWKEEGFSPITLVFEKTGANEFLCIESNKVYNRIVIKNISDKQLVFEWYDAYYEDAQGTIKNKEHFSVAKYSFMR